VIKSNPTPCTDWVQKLSARHPDDLSPSDRIALHEHLASCRACTEVHTSYQTMEAGIRSLLSSKPVPVSSHQFLQLERKAAPVSGFSLPGIISLVLSAFSSLLIKISWSRLYQELHTWVLIAFAHFPQRVAYMSSNSHHTYAIRSGSGFILWQQERYYQHDLISTAPVRWSGMCYIGAGIAYVSALDFCRYTARA
jgi:anti-sigma factor RsiW